MNEEEERILRKELLEIFTDINQDEKSNIFVNHVKGHLQPKQEVMCKICGKFIEEVYEETIAEKVDIGLLNIKERRMG